MPFDTTTQTGSVGISSSRDYAPNADAALLLVAATEQVKTGLRPVTQADPAWFHCGGRFNRDGSERADYGKVFWTPTAPGSTAYYFDRKGNDFALWMMGGDREGQLIIQGRAFEIAGATDPF